MVPPIKVDSEAAEPLVQQIQNHFREQIRSRSLAYGTQLPSMRQLSEQLGVSLGIVKQALNTLTAEGFLTSSPRRGVFVSEPRHEVRDIALVLPSLENEQMARVIRGVRNGLIDAPYRLVIQAANTDFEGEMHLLRYLDPKLVAGVIIYPPRLKSFVEPLRELRDRKIPCIQAVQALDGVDTGAVVVDGMELGRLAFDHLLQQGHRRIGFVDVTADTPTFVEMRRGAAMALRRFGLAFNDIPKLSVGGADLDPESPWSRGEEAASRLLKHHTELTAIVGVDPHVTLGVYRAIRAQGLRIPEDISVIGMGSDLPAFSMLEPSITIVDMPMEAMCERAALQLQQMIDGEDTVARTIHLQPRVIERKTVAAPRA